LATCDKVATISGKKRFSYLQTGITFIFGLIYNLQDAVSSECYIIFAHVRQTQL
jgi:hypothetical protein